MKKALLSVILGVTTSVAAAMECPRFTDEQRYYLDMAYTVGSQNDPQLFNVIGTHLGHTLAAIIWREAFVGPYIIRHNPNDPSYGIGHMLASTAMWLDGIEYTLENRHKYEQDYIIRLMSDDSYAINMSYRYLRRYSISTGSIRVARMRYNGSGADAREYADNIAERVAQLINCGVFVNE